jgi:hypothetical protein
MPLSSVDEPVSSMSPGPVGLLRVRPIQLVDHTRAWVCMRLSVVVLDNRNTRLVRLGNEPPYESPARSAEFPEPDQPDATSPAVLVKTFRFRRRANHRYHSAHPPRQEGRIAIVTDAGLDAVDAAASGAIVVAGRVLP